MQVARAPRRHPMPLLPSLIEWFLSREDVILQHFCTDCGNTVQQGGIEDHELDPHSQRDLRFIAFLGFVVDLLQIRNPRKKLHSSH